jgi:chaperonin GroES
MVSCLDHSLNKKEFAIMTTNFTPLHDRILVRREEEVGTTRGGLIIPDSAKDKPQEGTVISVGNGKTNEEGKLFPLTLKEGDTILFGKYSGTEITLDGEDFLIMKEEEVLGIVTGTAKKESVIPRETVGARK